MKIFKYIFKYKFLVFIAMLLLIIESFCTFMPPYLGSLSIDYGVKQNGIFMGLPVVFDKATYKSLLTCLDEDDRNFVNSCYFENISNSDSKSGVQVYQLSLVNLILDRDKLDDIIIPFLSYIHHDENHNGVSDFIEKSEADKLTQNEIDNARLYIKNIDRYDLSKNLYDDAVSEKTRIYNTLGYDKTTIQITFIFVMFIITLLFSIILFISNFIGNYIASQISYKISRDLRARQFEKVMSFTDADIDKFSKSSLLTRATTDLQIVQNSSVLCLRMVLIAPFMLMFGLIMAYFTAPSLAWLIWLVIAIILVVSFILIVLTVPKFKIMQKLIDNINNIVNETITGVSTIRSLNKEKFQDLHFNSVNKKLYKINVYTFRVLMLGFPFLTLLLNLFNIVLVWCGYFQIQDELIDIGKLISFTTYFTEIIFAFVNIIIAFFILPRANVSLGRIEKVIKYNPVMSFIDSGAYNSEFQSLNNIDEYITFKDVSFAFGNNKIFNSINIKIKKNTINVVVGPTGSGKSIFLKLLMRHYDVDKGSVKINGINVKNYPEYELRDMLGYVPQKVFLFNGTIRENVSLSPKAINDDIIESSIVFSNMNNFVESNVDGLNFIISQNAKNLSGGQKQRLSISRAIAKNSPIIVLDDPFSAVDAKTESIINDNLFNIKHNKTVIFSTQRLSSIQRADNIIFINNEHSIDYGSHNELIARNNQYKQMYNVALNIHD